MPDPKEAIFSLFINYFIILSTIFLFFSTKIYLLLIRFTMKAMILAAGRGQRLRPLTDTLPKPLISIGKDSLISRLLKQLKQAGFNEIVINHAWLGDCLENTLKNGSAYGVKIHYSREHMPGLETAGGIKKALPLLTNRSNNSPFLVINGDIFTDFNLAKAKNIGKKLYDQQLLAHLWLVPNPPHHPQGDYSLQDGFLAPAIPKQSYTFSGIGVYQPAFFDKVPAHTPWRLANVFAQYFDPPRISSSIYHGLWQDVGNLSRLKEVRAWITAHPLEES